MVFNQPPRPTQPGHPSEVDKMSTGVKTGSFVALSKHSAAAYITVLYCVYVLSYVVDDADCRLQRLSAIVLIKRHYYYYYYY